MDELNLFSKCVLTDNSVEDQFVGIQYSESDVTVFFPMGYEIPRDDEECRNSILTLLRTISLSNSIIQDDIRLNDQLKEDYRFPISSYLWVLHDYLSNGIYKSTDSVVKKIPSGKINWKKTIQGTPIFSNEQAVYLDVYTNHNITTDDIITQIHILCLNDAIKHIGFLFGKFELRDTFITFDNKEYLVSILNQALLNSNEDHKINLLVNLRNILLGLDIIEDDRTISNYGVKGFQLVWQNVVNRLFANEELTGYKPAASYYLPHEKKATTKRSLELDGLLVKDGVYYVLDAKYYQFGRELSSEYAPGSPDVNKQITYGEYVDLKHGEKYNVYNSFVVPYNKYNNKYVDKYHENIEYAGYSLSNWKKYDENVKPYYVVTIILVDCRFALDNWVFNDSKPFIQDIINKILEIKPLLKEYGWLELPIID